MLLQSPNNLPFASIPSSITNDKKASFDLTGVVATKENKILTIFN